ncbi:MAG: hypothetical protein ACYC9Y_04810 [Candidatus Methylomirabilia bacterium]
MGLVAPGRSRDEARTNDVAQDQGDEKRKRTVDPFIQKVVLAHGDEVCHVKNKKYQWAKHP